jgi:hypothetical protein
MHSFSLWPLLSTVQMARFLVESEDGNFGNTTAQHLRTFGSNNPRTREPHFCSELFYRALRF